ncbi:hypothetical protein JTX96_000992 [Escherichia coli]|nr:hypothetical protein [Escherichia coli]
MAISVSKRNVLRTRKKLEQWHNKATDAFEKSLGEGVIYAARALQRKINKTIDNPTRWTKQAIGSTSYMNKRGSRHQIFVKGARDIDTKKKKFGNQDDYLKHYFDGSGTNKIIPILNGKVVDSYGNIKALARGQLMHTNKGSDDNVEAESKRFVRVKTDIGSVVIRKRNKKKTRVKRARNGSSLAKRRSEKRVQLNRKRIVAVRARHESPRRATLGSWQSNEVMMLEHIQKHIKARRKYV